NRARVLDVRARGIRELLGGRDNRHLQLEDLLHLRKDLLERGQRAENDDVRLRRLDGLPGVGRHLEPKRPPDFGDLAEVAASIGGALREGSARLMRAPAVLAGTIALAAAFAPGVPLPGAWRSAGTSWADMLSVVRGMLFWSFLSGGILDRYARERATRGRGF